MQRLIVQSGLLLVLFAVSTVVAQEKPILSTDPPPAAPKRLLLKETGKAKVLYNDRTDESVASSGSVPLFRTAEGWGTISSSYSFKGKSILKPAFVTISIFVAAKDRSYVDDRKLVLYADKKRIFDGRSELKDGRTNGREIYSSLEISIPFEDFERLAKADTLTVEVGPTTFEITSANLAGFRDLLTLINEAS